MRICAALRPCPAPSLVVRKTPPQQWPLSAVAKRTQADQYLAGSCCDSVAGEEDSEAGAASLDGGGSGSGGDEDGAGWGRRLEDLSEDDLDENDWGNAEKQQELEDQLE